MSDSFPLDLFQTSTPLSEVVIRLSLAIALGGAIGLDREFRQKAAGLRTHILVTLEAAIFTLITFEIYFEMAELTDNPQIDAIRLIEAVPDGDAFLPAGPITQTT